MDHANRILAFIQWLYQTGLKSKNTLDFTEQLTAQLCAFGLPLARYSTAIPSLHPQIVGFSSKWTPKEGVTFRQYEAEDRKSEEYLNSPFRRAFEQGLTHYYDLRGRAETLEYGLLRDLKNEGITGYMLVALPFSDGSFKAVSFATDQDDGFQHQHLEFIEALQGPLAAAIEIRYLNYTAGLLMDTYVGPIAGQRVLKGDITRGSGETIDAVIWFCDLKGFTALSEQASSTALINVLNRYFEGVCTAIEAGGGEVLKFIGDAVLAVFQTGDSMAQKALEAAGQALVNLEQVNHDLAVQDLPPVECGIALHKGTVVYGNIGSATRLDFTVIGQDVNLASRIEALTRDLQAPILVSEAFAQVHQGNFECEGRFALKGLSGTHAVYRPLGEEYKG